MDFKKQLKDIKEHQSLMHKCDYEIEQIESKMKDEIYEKFSEVGMSDAIDHISIWHDGILIYMKGNFTVQIDELSELFDYDFKMIYDYKASYRLTFVLDI